MNGIVTSVGSHTLRARKREEMLSRMGSTSNPTPSESKEDINSSQPQTRCNQVHVDSTPNRALSVLLQSGKPTLHRQLLKAVLPPLLHIHQPNLLDILLVLLKLLLSVCVLRVSSEVCVSLFCVTVYLRVFTLTCQHAFQFNLSMSPKYASFLEVRRI